MRISRNKIPLFAALACILLFMLEAFQLPRPAPAAQQHSLAAPAPTTAPAAVAQAAARAPATATATRPAPAIEAASPTIIPTIPTPTARPAGAPLRVGLHVGHWRTSELPDELARLRTSTGAYVNGLAEVDLNLAIARRVEQLLVNQGVIVDVLPATVPPSYDADAFVAIHADGVDGASKRGYKLATPWRTSQASRELLEALDAAYGRATGLPKDDTITVNMRGYYAFNYRRHVHAIARTTPAIILEMGFLTSAADRAIMYGKADLVAAGISNGIMRYLQQRDPNDGAALLPPEFPTMRPASEQGAIIRSAPRPDARIIAKVGPDTRLFAFQEKDGWLEVMVRSNGQSRSRVIGWVRKDTLVATNDPVPTPMPSSDS